VTQPDSREEWYSDDFLNPAGHPVNLAGVEFDSHFRPLNKHGQVVHKNLFSAGTILAHQDWKRMKCGAGLSITTAFAAVNSAASWLDI